MAVKVGTLVYEKPEPLISEQFEEAVKIANRDSVETLEVTKAGLKKERKELVFRGGVAFVVWAVAVVLLFVQLALTGQSSPLFISTFIVFGGSWAFGARCFAIAKEKQMTLATVRTALQLKTRKEEIIALLP